MYGIHASGNWYCCICSCYAEESHLESKNHVYYLNELPEGKIQVMASLPDMVRPGSPPLPPPGQPTGDLPGPPPAPPPRGQASAAAAVSQESIILIKVHTKLDIILEKLGSMEAGSKSSSGRSALGLGREVRAYVLMCPNPATCE